jgi:hypothetical protein
MATMTSIERVETAALAEAVGRWGRYRPGSLLLPD